MEEKDELKERLDILQSAGMIEDRVVRYCEEVLKLLYKERDEYDQEAMEIFVTHLAMAMQRAYQNTCEEDIDVAILEALKCEPAYEKAKILLELMVHLSEILIPRSEQQLLLIHLCNICTKKQKGE